MTLDTAMQITSADKAWAQWRDQNIYLDRNRSDSKMISFKAGYASAIGSLCLAGWRWRPFGGIWVFANSEKEAVDYAEKHNGVYECIYASVVVQSIAHDVTITEEMVDAAWDCWDRLADGGQIYRNQMREILSFAIKSKQEKLK